MLSANSNSTTLPASNRSVQCACPAGAALHAKADQSLPRTGYGVRFRLAVQLALPARPRLVIDGGLKSFLHVPLPRSGNGSSVDQKHIGYLTVPKPFVSFEQRQRPLDCAD